MAAFPKSQTGLDQAVPLRRHSPLFYSDLTLGGEFEFDDYRFRVEHGNGAQWGVLRGRRIAGRRIENFGSGSGTIGGSCVVGFGNWKSRLKLYASTATASPLDPFGITAGT